jgi:hypothetical protein
LAQAEGQQLMSAFHQIGHNSENLIFDEGLARLGGAILSPLNYGPADVADQIARLKDRANFVTIFDPHLYRPQSERMRLPEWDYYPKDVETADINEKWWESIVGKVAKTAIELGVSAVSSPAIVPKTFPDDFFLQLIDNGNRLERELRGCTVRPMQTVVVNMADLSVPARAMTIASIISRSRISDCMLVLVNNIEPRRELTDPEELKGAMRLIATLETGGQHVTVAFSSSEMMLWKAAGATNCATGKYFNLRRFTISRFDEPNGGGGGQLGYWFEESLLAFLRQSDVLRVRDRSLVSEASTQNPFCASILEAIPTKQAWVALGWRQFLYWFADSEFRLCTGAVSAEDLVGMADANWAGIENSKPRLYMEERQNDGIWVRQWLRAIVEFPYFR